LEPCFGKEALPDDVVRNDPVVIIAEDTTPTIANADELAPKTQAVSLTSLS
jgi:hypothetical protein